MIDIQELELEFNAFYGDKENEHTLLARMFPLIAEVKRLREQLLRGVEMMNMTPNQTKEARKNRAKNFEREVRRMIE
jgi:hypothetical protein